LETTAEFGGRELEDNVSVRKRKKNAASKKFVVLRI
jgi:hypothetical protein